MRHTLDAALVALGYVRTDAGAERMRYVRIAPASWRARAQSVNVRIKPHTLEVVGPIPTLRALQAALAGGETAQPERVIATAPALPGRETVAGAMQISDNAGRVAGMAE
ncbi:hypothetical protein G4G28_22160 [Massilia sp. Dwa41.01b]|uniref:hypothetical protein n=1 Tax=Massilia sp. Dwa41.01b TaxID=2709302 RepID=UPI001600D74A|nr:hypothetical protein [Massilia sp. Dwa41.01b]QNA90531.1 hypothetical protein G4G28_22160 [Massilia sp. Dwa41.01b]